MVLSIIERCHDKLVFILNWKKIRGFGELFYINIYVKVEDCNLDPPNKFFDPEILKQNVSEFFLNTNKIGPVSKDEMTRKTEDEDKESFYLLTETKQVPSGTVQVVRVNSVQLSHLRLLRDSDDQDFRET